MPAVVLSYLDNAYPRSMGIMEFQNGRPDTVAYGFDLSQFQAPATVKLTYDMVGNLDRGLAFLEIGGGRNSDFDYDLAIGGSIGAGSKFGINVLGASSLHLSISQTGKIYLDGEIAFNAPTLSKLLVENNGVIQVLGAGGLALDIGGGNVTNSGLIVADTAVMFGGAPTDGTAKIALMNVGTIAGAVVLSPGGDILTNSGVINGEVRLGDGADSYDGRLGSSRGMILGEGGVDSLVGGSSADSLDGGAGSDTISGGQGDDLILDSSGSNYLRGDDGNDSISGGANFDDINGNVGNDTVHGNDGDDWVVGGKDNDLLFGDNGFDIVYGNLGDDTISGGSGADWVRGGQGNDSVSGGDGDDWLWGDRGDDTLSGGQGADIFHSFAGAGVDRITDFSLAEGDRVQLDPGSTFSIRQSGADTVIDLGGGDQVILVGVQASTLAASSVFVG